MWSLNDAGLFLGFFFFFLSMIDGSKYVDSVILILLLCWGSLLSFGCSFFFVLFGIRCWVMIPTSSGYEKNEGVERTVRESLCRSRPVLCINACLRLPPSSSIYIFAIDVISIESSFVVIFFIDDYLFLRSLIALASRFFPSHSYRYTVLCLFLPRQLFCIHLLLSLSLCTILPSEYHQNMVTWESLSLLLNIDLLSCVVFLQTWKSIQL